MEQLKQPSTLSLTGNWRSWEKSLHRFISGSGEEDENVKIAILLATIGQDAVDVYNTLTVTPEGEKLTLEDVLQAFKRFCCPQKNVFFERYLFWSHRMSAGISVDGFLAELRQKSNDCEFGMIENDMLRDKLVFSITDSLLKRRLLQESGLTLHRAIEICRATEKAKTSVDAESEHQHTSNYTGHQRVQNTNQTERLLLGAFMPKVQMHRLKLQQALTDQDFSERRNVEQRIHIKEEPETFCEGQEEKLLCRQQETNSAACLVKYETEEEKPPMEINVKEEPSTCRLDKLIKILTSENKTKEPEAAMSLDPRMPTDLPQGEVNNREADYDGNCDIRQKPLSIAVEVEVNNLDYTKKLCDSRKNAETGCKAAKRLKTSSKPLSSDKTDKKMTFKLVKTSSECVSGNIVALNSALNKKDHTGEKPFQCDFCCKCFRRKSNLNTHMTLHTGEKPFRCDVCSKCFYRKSNLNTHMTVHTGEKPFTCEICSKCFSRKSLVGVHMRVHTREKPYICDFCSKCFTQKCHLNSHLTVHKGGKAFKCDVCSKCYSRKAELNKHLRVHTL